MTLPRFSKREKNLLAVLGVMIFVYLFYFRLYEPMDTRYSTLRRELDAKEVEARSMRIAATGIAKRQQELQDLTDRLDLIWQAVGNRPNQSWLVRSIESFAAYSGSRLVLFKPMDPQQHTYLVEQPFEVTLEGTFNSIVDFCRRANESRPIIGLESIRIDASTSTPTAIGPTLNVVISGKTYYRLQGS